MLNLLKAISKTAYNKLLRTDLLYAALGKYELGDGIYINIESYEPYFMNQRKFESHKKYVDIQFIIAGKEIIIVANASKCEINDEYNEEKDIVFYKNNVLGISHVLNEGQFLVLQPQEAHMTSIKVYGYDYVKKAVVKVPLDLFIKKKAINRNKIKYLIMDVDGTLTDGKIYMDENGEICKAFNIKDGCGIQDILKPAGIEPIIVTGRKSKILERRCEELGIKKLYQGVANKAERIFDLLREVDCNYSELAYIGDDINDIVCLKIIKSGGGVIGCPADATETVKDIVDFVSAKNGGDGAVREFIEWILHKKNEV